MVACFGFPLAYEDAAGRAARTGLAILEGMTIRGERLRIAEGLPLDPWVGIHTGAAVVEEKVGAVSLVGEARNVAVRLEDVAVAGQMICTEASHRLFQGRFQCVSLGRQKIKSVPGLVELFRVEHVAVAGSPIDAVAPAELSPLTGRDREVGLLRDRWDQAREGMGQVVLLIGEPGLGKSRLVHTMKQHVLGQMMEGDVDAPVIEWRCSPHFQNTGLYPAIDFYERALGFDREVAPQARFDLMLHRLEQYDLARPETVPLWASLLSLPIPDRYPPLSLSPVRQREETFRAMLDWLHARAARTAGPVHRRGSALGGRVHAGVPGTVPRGGPARLHPDAAHLPPRVHDAVARRRSPDDAGTESAHAASGGRPDEDEDEACVAGGHGPADLRPHRRRAAVCRRVHHDGAGVRPSRPGRR